MILKDYVEWNLIGINKAIRKNRFYVENDELNEVNVLEFTKSLENVEFCNVKFNEVKFDGVLIKGARFVNCEFFKCHFTSNIWHSALKNCTFNQTQLCSQMRNCEIANCQFNNSSIETNMFKNCNIVNSIFDQIELNYVNFVDSLLNGNKFNDMIFENIGFQATKISKCSFENINGKIVNFGNSNVFENLFIDSKIKEVYFYDGTFNTNRFNMDSIFDVVYNHKCYYESNVTF